VPPRKRALASVPPPKDPARSGENSPVKKFQASGAVMGRNRAAALEKTVQNCGPDMPPGKKLSWLPAPEEVPPKPKTEPEMDWPGVGHHSAGHPEWQLRTFFADNARKLEAEGANWIVGRSWEVRWVPPDDRRCQARGLGKFSEWMGNRCTMKAIKGGKVCLTHGGKLGSVKKAAQAALARAALPAAEKLIHIAITKRGVTDADRIKAIIQILDRAGVEGKSTIELEIKPWQHVLQTIYSAQTGTTIDAEEVEGVDFELDDDGEEDEAWQDEIDE
jgi:hypothetical protein